MILTLENCPTYVRKNFIKSYINFADKNNYTLEARDIHPVTLIEWVFELVEKENFKDFNSQGFKHSFYYIMKNSKYPLSLFLKLNNVEKLTSHCSKFEPAIFNYIFDLFLEASRQFATNPKGIDQIKRLPQELPENKDEFGGWFLTNINDCFKILDPVDFYIWLDKQVVNLIIGNSEELAALLKSYLEFMKINYTKGKYKKKRRFRILIVRRFLKPGAWLHIV